MANVLPTVPGLANEAAADALGGTTHLATGVGYIAKTPADTWKLLVEQVKRILDAIGPWRAGEIVVKTGLNIGVFPCDYGIAGTIYHYAGSDSTVAPNNATTYYWLDTDQTLDSGVGYPAGIHFKLGKVVTSGGSVVSVTDHRLASLGPHAAAAWATFAATQDVSLGGFDIAALVALRFNNAAANPTVVREVQFNGDLLKYKDSTAVRTLISDAIINKTIHSVILGTGAGSLGAAAPGTVGRVLVDKGAGVDPAFQAINLALAAATQNQLLTSRGGTGVNSATPYQVPAHFAFAGNMSTGAKSETSLWVPAGTIIEAAKAKAGTAPSNAAIIIDVRDDGTSIWSGVQANMLQIPDGATVGVATGAAYTVPAGSYIDLEVEQVGGIATGADVGVTLILKPPFAA